MKLCPRCIKFSLVHPFKFTILAVKDSFLEPFQFECESRTYFLNIRSFHLSCFLVLAKDVAMAAEKDEISLIVKRAC
jgi:hypothetical protein